MMGRKGCGQFFRCLEVSVTVLSLSTQLCSELLYPLYLLVPASFALNVVSHRAYIPGPKKQAMTNSKRKLAMKRTETGQGDRLCQAGQKSNGSRHSHEGGLVGALSGREDAGCGDSKLMSQ